MDLQQFIEENRMRIHLFWIDNNWRKTGGTANNYNLIIDMENKIYKQFVDPFMGIIKQMI